jgi:hypothetical protein
MLTPDDISRMVADTFKSFNLLMETRLSDLVTSFDSPALGQPSDEMLYTAFALSVYKDIIEMSPFSSSDESGFFGWTFAGVVERMRDKGIAEVSRLRHRTA